MTVITVTVGIVLVVALICNVMTEKMRIKSNEIVKMYKIKHGKEQEENEKENH